MLRHIPAGFFAAAHEGEDTVFNDYASVLDEVKLSHLLARLWLRAGSAQGRNLRCTMNADHAVPPFPGRPA
ncbi:hypothetical protein D3C75_1309560 [compost metagenome]